MAPASAQRRELKCHLFCPNRPMSGCESAKCFWRGAYSRHSGELRYLIIVFRRDGGTDIADEKQRASGQRNPALNLFHRL